MTVEIIEKLRMGGTEKLDSLKCSISSDQLEEEELLLKLAVFSQW